MGHKETDLDPVVARGCDEGFMRQAIGLARVALERGDTPVGSVVVREGRVVAQGIEGVRSEKDFTAHAELRAVQEACRNLVTRDLEDCELYTTAEPCFMCSFVIRSAHISRVIMGKAVPHIGGVSSKYPILIDAGIPNWPPPPVVVRGVLENECNELFNR